MTKKRFEIDDDDEYLIDNKTGKLYDACGGGDGFPFIIDEYDKLEKENKQLKKIIKKYYDTTNSNGKQLISDLVDTFEMEGLDVEWMNKE